MATHDDSPGDPGNPARRPDMAVPAGAPAPPRPAPPPTQAHDPLALPASPPKPADRRAPPPVHSDRRSRHVGWRSRDVLRTAALVAAMWIGLKLVWLAHPLILVAFLGVLFGLAATAGVDRLARWKVPRGVGAALVVLGSVGLIVLFFAWSAPVIRTQSRELRTKLPEAVDKFDAWLERHRGGVLGLVLGEQGQVGAPAAERAATTPPQVDSARGARQDSTTGARGPITRAIASDSAGAPGGDTAGGASPTSAAADGTAGSQLRQRLFSGATGAKRYLFPFLTSTFAVIGGLLLILFLSIYVAADPATYHDGLMHLFPHGGRERAGEVLTAIATVLRKWLVTQLVAMLAIGTVTTVVLLLLKVRAAVPLGILAGLFEFIPTVGPILSALPALAMGFVDSPEKALWVAVAYIGIQFLENHILIPILMREGVNIPPALTIIAQAVFALVFGFIGLLVAVPVLAAGLVAVKMLYVEDVVGDPVDVVSDDEVE